MTSCTVVDESYLNDLVCPFSKKTLSTLGIKGTTESVFRPWNEKKCYWKPILRLIFSLRCARVIRWCQRFQQISLVKGSISAWLSWLLTAKLTSSSRTEKNKMLLGLLWKVWKLYFHGKVLKKLQQINITVVLHAELKETVQVLLSGLFCWAQEERLQKKLRNGHVSILICTFPCMWNNLLCNRIILRCLMEVGTRLETHFLCNFGLVVSHDPWEQASHLRH